MQLESSNRPLLAVAETLAALAIASALTMLLTVPLVFRHMTFEAEVPLVVSGETLEIPVEELAETFREWELGTRVQLIGSENDLPSLLLTGFPSLEVPTQTIHRLLEDAGYLPEPVETRPTMDIELLLRDAGHFLLGIQALVFLVVGGLAIRLRVWPGDPQGGFGPALLWGAGGGLAIFAASVGLSLLLQLIGFPVQEQEWIRALLQDRDTVWALTPWLVLLVPLAEEVFFRGYIFRFLSQRVSFTAGLWVSASFFAVIHFNLSGLLIYLVIGLALAGVYAKARNLLAPVAAHVVHNGLVLLTAILYPGA